MARSSHELLIPDHDFGFDTISDVEEPLDEALLAAGVGEVTGGGIGSGWYRIEMELERPREARRVIRDLAFRLDLPTTTLLRPSGAEQALPVYLPDPDDEAPPQETGGGGPV